METAYLLSILPGLATCLVSAHQAVSRMSLDTDNGSLEHRDNQGPALAEDEHGVETNFSNDDINNNVIPDDNNNTAEEAETNTNNNSLTEHVTVTPADVMMTQRPPNPVPASPLYLPQEPQVIQPPPPQSGPGLCPCPAVYNEPGASYYHLPPPDYQELSPANLPLQPNLPRYVTRTVAFAYF